MLDGTDFFDVVKACLFVVFMILFFISTIVIFGYAVWQLISGFR